MHKAKSINFKLQIGMFMVCAQLRSRDGFLVEHSCRSAMLHYRSTLLHALTTLTFSPMMIFGTTEEKQNVVLELFGNFEEDQSHPVTIIYIEIQSRHIEFYSATIMINAHLSGLRYLMYHWPILSAVVGIGTNLFFIALVCTLSYLHFTTYEDVGDDDFNYEESKKIEETDKHKEKLSTEEEEGQKATHDRKFFFFLCLLTKYNRIAINMSNFLKNRPSQRLQMILSRYQILLSLKRNLILISNS